MNENVSLLYSLIQENELNQKCVKSNMKYIDETELFNTCNTNIDQNEIVSFINTKLHSSGQERCKAINLLEKLLPHCVPDTFTKFALSWMQQCCRWNPGTINEELRVLCILIENSVSNSDVKKQTSSDVIPRFAERLTCVQDNSCKLTIKLKLKCLKSIIGLYSNVCNAHRNDFQKYVTHCLKEHSDVKQIVKEASVCFVLLCQCCNKGQQGINHKEAWSSQFNALIDTGNKLFSILYSSVDVSSLISDVSTEHVISGLLDLNDVYEKNPIMRFYGWKTKFAVISRLIQSMLLCKYPVSKSFQPSNLFNLICRFLSINETVLKKCAQTNDIQALNANLSDMHEYTFDILQALILSAKRNLIPYGTLICKLCLQALKWTHSDANSTSKQFRSLRCKVYTVLSSWLSVSASSSSIEIFADEIIPIAVSDIESIKPVVKLAINLKPTKRNKRKREQTNSEMGRQPDSVATSSKVVYEEICVCAHRMLQLLISSASVFIRWEHHKKLQHTVIPLLLESFNATPVSHYPQLYSDAECRLQLFKTLFVLTIEPHWKCKMLTSLTSKILDTGTNDCDVKISAFCKHALNQLEIIVHPRGPSLTLSQIDQDTSTNDITDRVSKIATALSNQTDMQPIMPHEEQITNNPSVSVVKNLEAAVIEVIAPPEKPENYATKNDAVLLKSPEKCKHNTVSADRIAAAEDRSSHDGKQCEESTQLNEISATCDEISASCDNDVPNKKMKIIESIQIGDKSEDAEIVDMLNDFVDTLQ